jgi:hypothetical protein
MSGGIPWLWRHQKASGAWFPKTSSVPPGVLLAARAGNRAVIPSTTP